jgi:hypothetical protein
MLAGLSGSNLLAKKLCTHRRRIYRLFGYGIGKGAGALGVTLGPA